MCKNAIIVFCDFFKMKIFSQHYNAKPKILRYKSHVCYALIKFTREFKQTNNLEKSKDMESNSKLYIDPACVNIEFANWIKTVKKNNGIDGVVSFNERKKSL
ncbi:hypothetical protein PAEPH01_2126 [Pancytospora epiphaga]|nr:hypothetical protein PAEPH01_2126 [Pancytospora epiphaga]